MLVIKKNIINELIKRPDWANGDERDLGLLYTVDEHEMLVKCDVDNYTGEFNFKVIDYTKMIEECDKKQNDGYIIESESLPWRNALKITDCGIELYIDNYDDVQYYVHLALFFFVERRGIKKFEFYNFPREWKD